MTAKYDIDFERGELVRVRTVPEVVGQVIGEKDWGKSFLIRYCGAEDVCWYENIELETYRPSESNAGFGHDEEPPKSMSRKPRAARSDNVINLAAARAAGRG